MPPLNDYSSGVGSSQGSNAGGGAQGSNPTVNVPSFVGAGTTCTSCNPNANISNSNLNVNSNQKNMNPLNGNWRGCRPPAPINLVATVGALTTNLYLGDAVGLYAAYGGAGVGAQEFGMVGSATVANLKEILKTKWYYVSGFNLGSTNPATIQNTLQIIGTDMDGLDKPITISSSANVSNQQYNPNLLNVCCGFILTQQEALKLPTTVAGEIVNLTLTIGACGYYGDLADFLATNPNLTCSVPSNCLR